MAVERADASYSELLASLAEEEAVVPAILVAELLAGVRSPATRGAPPAARRRSMRSLRRRR